MNIETLKSRYKAYKEKRFLENHGCKTWEEYEYRFDPRVSVMARWAHTYYHGYPHVVPLDSQGLRDYGMLGVLPYHDLAEQMVEWCNKNCKGKWRNDWHRGHWDHNGYYEFNGISGGDVVFFAFVEDQDYMMFKLRWS
jgi:hypothetical protein